MSYEAQLLSVLEKMTSTLEKMALALERLDAKIPPPATHDEISGARLRPKEHK